MRLGKTRWPGRTYRFVFVLRHKLNESDLVLGYSSITESDL